MQVFYIGQLFGELNLNVIQFIFIVDLGVGINGVVDNKYRQLDMDFKVIINLNKMRIPEGSSY